MNFARRNRTDSDPGEPDRQDDQNTDGEWIEHAIGLLSQQEWCWGKDIMRPEGNWLIEIGFNRMESPVDRESCSSTYLLELPGERSVLLRGFGVFYGDRQHGGVFLPRFEFRPKYTTMATLERPPWTPADLPELFAPTKAQRHACQCLTLDLIDWIRRYEMTIVERLGIEYRRRTLSEWDNGKRRFTPAEEMASAWHKLSLQIAANADACF